jgi:magnesium chelatase family protein
MTLAIVHSRARLGIEAPLVTVETHLSNGLPSLSIVGLPEATVKESKDRVRSAILNSHFEFPARRITINLAPADLPKEGGRYDLPIALSILAASGQVPLEPLQEHEFLGELALSGELRPVPGALPAAVACTAQQRSLVLPNANTSEAAIPGDTNAFGAGHLLEVCAHLQKKKLLQTAVHSAHPEPVRHPDLSEVRGQAQARRALEIAAAGNHNLLFYGPPGTGKTMLASRLPGILPPLSHAETLEIACIRSIAGLESNNNHGIERPFRAPHHSASAVAIVGGGSNPRPGEISLAHAGVLFLDELPEFQRKVLEVMREPLEAGTISIARANHSVSFPCRFQLIAAMNPCPCGYAGTDDDRCRCTPDQVNRYQNRLSGPLLDRIDLHVEVARLPTGLLWQGNAEEESSETVQQRVIRARQRQTERSGTSNARLSANQVSTYCKLKKSDARFFEKAIDKLGLSARAYHRCLKLARTIADLSESNEIKREHLREALSYRQFSHPV